LDVTSASVVERMLDPATKLGTSTPKVDPSGDYAWAVFRKVDQLQPGSFAKLDQKALKLIGSPSSPASNGSNQSSLRKPFVSAASATGDMISAVMA
jgi:ABC-type molybdate transport system substrate-binding protein